MAVEREDALGVALAPHLRELDREQFARGREQLEGRVLHLDDAADRGAVEHHEVVQGVGAEGLEALRDLGALLHEGGGDLNLTLGHVAKDGEHCRTVEGEG